MQLWNKFKFTAAGALSACAPAVFAHDETGWASIHWHASDLLGLATVGGLAVAALWLSRRQKRGEKHKSRK